MGRKFVKAYVVGSSALHAWRRNQAGATTLKREVANPLTDCPTTPQELEAIGLSRFDLGTAPIRLMVPSYAHRISKRSYKYRVHSRGLPKDAFRQLGDRVCLASPELCLIQSACVLSRYQLMELCMELCGTYALLPEEPRGYICRNFQLASVASIRSFLREASELHGSKRLSIILKYLQDGSNSPMETRAYLLACLPKRYGGFGLPKAELNARINLDAEERRIARREHFKSDMSWPHAMVIVEYDGHDDHESRESRARDATRRNILLSKGYTVFTLTGRQLCNAFEFAKVVADIARSIHHRMRDFPENWEDRHRILRRELFKSMTSYETERFL